MYPDEYANAANMARCAAEVHAKEEELLSGTIWSRGPRLKSLPESVLSHMLWLELCWCPERYPDLKRGDPMIETFKLCWDFFLNHGFGSYLSKPEMMEAVSNLGLTPHITTWEHGRDPSWE